LASGVPAARRRFLDRRVGAGRAGRAQVGAIRPIRAPRNDEAAQATATIRRNRPDGRRVASYRGGVVSMQRHGRRRGDVRRPPPLEAFAMSSIQSILVHMDASPRSAMRLAIARELARRQGAEMVCALLALEPPLMPAVETVPPTLITQIESDRRTAARALFDDVLAEGSPPMAWDEVVGDTPVHGFVEAALYFDLMVLGQQKRDDLLAVDVPPGFVSDVLLDSGKPALIVPYAGEFETVATDVLIAWKPTRECARAVACAIPLLQQAKKVQVLSWSGAEPAPAELTYGIRRYLGWHGIDAEVRRYAEVPDDLGELLLSRVADEGADLLVMGCYGHSRLRELVLGGVTRVILESMTCPVLMAH
jgi:nucleotide-binding universal stress UspA family protein